MKDNTWNWCTML